MANAACATSAAAPITSGTAASTGVLQRVARGSQPEHLRWPSAVGLRIITGHCQRSAAPAWSARCLGRWQVVAEMVVGPMPRRVARVARHRRSPGHGQRRRRAAIPQAGGTPRGRRRWPGRSRRSRSRRRRLVLGGIGRSASERRAQLYPAPFATISAQRRTHAHPPLTSSDGGPWMRPASS
jgi:hypothetical protein